MEEIKTTESPKTTEKSTGAKNAQSDAKADKKRIKKLETELSDLQKKLDEATEAAHACDDKYMRMMAEYDNFRKRTAKEKEGIYADAYADCIANILPILDNLERASQSDHFEAVKKGLEMTAKAFGDALGKMGISEIETKTFDPNLHEAVMHIEDENFGESEIVEVFRKGYAKGDKVIRYAMVKVAN